MENIQHITIDIMDNQTYEYIYASQYDQGRQIVFEVTENGNPFDLSGVNASFEMRKPDNTIVWLEGKVDGNTFTIDVIDQMTVLSGNRMPFRLQFVERKDISNNDTVKVIATVNGYMKVSPAVMHPDDVKSKDAYNELVYLISVATASLDSIKESVDSAKDSVSKAKISETNAKTSEINALQSEHNASTYLQLTIESSNNAKASEDAAAESKKQAESFKNDAELFKDSAFQSEQFAADNAANAYDHMTNAKDYMDSANASASLSQSYMGNAIMSAQNAHTSEENAKTSETNAKSYMDSALTYQENASSYARDAKIYSDNALTYSNNAKTSEDETLRWRNDVYDVVDRLSGALIPMGTISFSELSSKDKITGHMYNINEAFISTQDFIDGGGVAYAKGSNVYCTGIGKWEVLVNPDGEYGGSCVIVISNIEPPIQPINNLWLQEHL